MTPTAQRLLVVIGALLLVVPPLLWHQTRPPTDVGTPPTGAAPTAPPTTDAGSGPTAQTADDAEVAPGDTEQTPSSATALADSSTQQPTTQPTTQPTPQPTPQPTTPDAQPPAGTRPAPPLAVSLPALGVHEAPVDAVGLDDAGAVQIPDDVRRVGWYRQGPRPGEPGNAFFTSHVDSRTQGRGVLFDLSRSQPGDPIEVIHADGSTSIWQVVARERIEKGSYPMDRVFRFDGEPGLVIDTCGGPFDASTGSYENIDIVYAVPAG